MITEIAIVISAWRRSCPWFQRRNPCWTMSPSPPMRSIATAIGISHSQVVTSSLGTKPGVSAVSRCWTSYAM